MDLFFPHYLILKSIQMVLQLMLKYRNPAVLMMSTKFLHITQIITPSLWEEQELSGQVHFSLRAEVQTEVTVISNQKIYMQVRPRQKCGYCITG